MQDLLDNPALLALIATVFGGVGLNIIEHWLNKSKTHTDTAAALRHELREDLARLRDDLNNAKKETEAVEHELDEWKAKYYTLMTEFIKIRAELDNALNILRSFEKQKSIKLQQIANELENPNA